MRGIRAVGKGWAVGAIGILFAASVWGYEKSALPGRWSLQPAVSPDAEPAAAAWGESESVDWRHNRRPGKGTPWEKIKHGEVHSLWYERTFSLSAGQAAGQVALDFERIEGDAIIFLNGERLGELLRPGGWLDLAGKARAGENRLRVFVTRSYTGISRGPEKDPLRFLSRGGEAQKAALGKYGLGITADVWLMALPRPAGLADVFVQTSVRKKEIALALDLRAVAPTEGVSARIEIFNAEGSPSLSFDSPLSPVPAGTSSQTVRRAWENPRLWELEDSYLYRAKVSLLKDGRTLDTGYETPFGFREVWTEGRSVILNGHPQRFRVEWTAFGISENSLPMLRLLGRNFVYQQANPTMWWQDWPETPVFSCPMLDLLDRAGIGTALPVPGVSAIRDHLLSDQQVEADYRRELAHLWRRYRNRPSVLLWTVSMNSYNPKDAIHPGTIGVRSTYSHPQARTIERARAIVLESDATRLVYGHADGNLGDLATSNFYPNWMPLQEREDYFELWAQRGNMPYLAAEFAAVYGGDWYKGKRLLLTEYAARVLGDAAYAAEPPEALTQTFGLGQGNLGHGNSLKKAVALLPAFWEVERLHTVGTDRAWRTWGVQGWHYFNFGLGYGDPPEFTRPRPYDRYSVLQKPVVSRPAWANPAFDYYAEAMQPLLAYVAGTPTHTDKTHAFFGGAEVAKRAAFVWDGSSERSVRGAWSCVGEKTGERFAGGAFDLTLKPGDIAFRPLTFAAPQVKAKTEAVLRLEIFEAGAKSEGKPLVSDAVALEFFPGTETAALSGTVALFDPEGTAFPALVRLGIAAQRVSSGAEARAHGVLVIAPGALERCPSAPFTADDVRGGLRVVVLEQKPEVWEGFGLRTLEAASRQVFLRERGAAETAGLSDRDLHDWSGVPAGYAAWKRWRAPDVQVAPKGSNRHVVSYVALETPDVVGFTPVLASEFDLAYSPLLRWQCGKGAVWFCTLDLPGRAESNPAAALLTRQLVQAALAYRETTRPVLYAGDAAGRAQLERLGCEAAEHTAGAVAGALLVIGPGSGLTASGIDAFISGGGRVFVLPQTAEGLRGFGWDAEERVFTKGAPCGDAPFRAVGPDLLRDRTASSAVLCGAGGGAARQAVADGLLGRGWQGQAVFCQADPEALLRKFPEGQPGFDSAALTVVRWRQLQARLLTALGATPSAASAERAAAYVPVRPVYEALRHWQLLGPFYPDAAQAGAKALDAAFPGEANALAGDTNPNATYATPDGRQLNFRKTAMAGTDGFVDLAAALNPERAPVVYAVREVTCAQARIARLRLGLEYFAKVWVNGQLVYQVDSGHGAPRANRFALNVPLKAGANVLALKIAAGAKGCGFWANLSLPGAHTEAATPEGSAAPALYDAALRKFDPYEYHYW